jgi:hypothetical protein
VLLRSDALAAGRLGGAWAVGRHGWRVRFVVRAVGALLAAWACLGAGAALAGGPLETVDLHPEADAGGEEPSVVFAGHYRFRFTHLDRFSLGAGTTQDQENYGTHRLRLAPSARLATNWRLFGEVDILDGVLFGDTSSVGRQFMARTDEEPMQGWTTRLGGQTLDSLMLRKLYVEWNSPIGRFALGQMASDWGLGLVANGGADPGSDFDDTHFGDIVERLSYTTRPFAPFFDNDFAQHMFISVGGDLVFRDDNADLVEGDLAFQFVTAMGYASEDHFAGVYFAYRNQEDRDGDELEAFAVDVAGRFVERWEDEGVVLTAQAEAAVLTGTTNRARFEAVPDELDILSFGAAAQVDVRHLLSGVEGTLRMGFASGDANAADGTVRTFSFDAEHRVGMILFEQVIGRMSLRAADQVADPAYSAQPPKGFESIPSGGQIENTVYIQPIFRYRPLDGLTLRLGFLWAMSVVPLTDPFASASFGGYPVGYRGARDPSLNLGYELDGGVDYEAIAFDVIALRFGLQVGGFFPGGAFDDAEGNAMDPVVSVRALFDFVF